MARPGAGDGARNHHLFFFFSSPSLSLPILFPRFFVLPIFHCTIYTSHNATQLYKFPVPIEDVVDVEAEVEAKGLSLRPCKYEVLTCCGRVAHP